MKYLTFLLLITFFACAGDGTQMVIQTTGGIEAEDYICPAPTPTNHYIVDNYNNGINSFDINSDGTIRIELDGLITTGIIDSFVEVQCPASTMWTGRFKLHVCNSDNINKGVYRCDYQYNYAEPYDGSKASLVKVSCEGSMYKVMWKQWDNWL